MESSVDCQVALVTGASSGIGEATARRFAAEGAAVAVAARREDRLEELVTELKSDGADAFAVPTDVRDESQVASLIEQTVTRFGRIDVGVVSAGIGCGASDVSELETRDYRRLMETNVDGAFFTTRELLPHLREHDGTLVFVGSYAGQYPYGRHPLYGASKAWLRAFAHNVEAQAGDDGVAVSLVNPGGVRTSFAFDDGVTQAERYGPGEAVEADEVAELIVLAATTGSGTTLSEVDLYRRDQLSLF